MAPRRQCPTCGSRKWHKEPASGLIACSEGHVYQNYRNEMTDTEMLGAHTMKKRTLKTGKKKKGRPSKANPKLYHGDRARFHYFQCLQLLLRKQVAALTRLWKVPEVFEVVCRDLWALHISLLEKPIPAEPYYHQQETADIKLTQPEDSTLRPEAEAEDSSSSSDGDEELEELMRQNSEISSEDEEDGDGDPDARPSNESSSGRRSTSQRASETPLSTIVILVLTCWTLRIPALYRDFVRAIEAYDLPYLESTRYLPASMTVHLNRANVQALSPPHAPKIFTMHTLCARLARRLNVNYGVFIPEVNAAPVLYRVVRAMHGPPILYSLVKRLAFKLCLPLTLHNSLAPDLEQTSDNSSRHHKYDNVPPELSFMVVAIIVLKMMYGLDGKTRVARRADHPQLLFPQLKEYLRVLQERKPDQTDLFSSEVPLSIPDQDPSTLDAYLDFCEKALLDDDKTETRPGFDLVRSFFPLAETKTVESDQNSCRSFPEEDRGETPLPLNECDEESEELEPGEEYTVYDALDVCGEVEREMEIVVRRGAEWVGVDVEDIFGVLEMFERRLVKGS